MAEISWLVRRLKAMSASEVIWRLSQKRIQKMEEMRFRTQKQAVTDTLFHPKLEKLRGNPDRMHLNLRNREFSLNTTIPMPGGYDYGRYKKSWNAGFQTEHTWPERFSYLLRHRQRDDIGDARTNWELNRHFQFAILAKDYGASGDLKYLREFQQLFDDWNEKNLFLWGISWTSVMEVAIRCSNWCYAYCFLAGSDSIPHNLIKKLQIGILNMTDYIVNHYSRFSSANNHLIIEAYAIGQSGILFGNQEWIQLAVSILTRELPLQNEIDGVNKEQSLHYQAFYMEAMGLLMRLLRKNGLSVPNCWPEWLGRMCCYLTDCMGNHGEVIEFGDNDNGKILDLSGGLNYYRYVLELFSILLDKQYCSISDGVCENMKWLFSEEEVISSGMKSKYIPPGSACYIVGGNTILRSEDRRILIGIDHAALGFGSIAAHGHSDALSFQMYMEGKPVFVDPGTYLYHCDLPSRNTYRKTQSHNTVCIDGKNQSEMLGAFLWGKRADCELLEFIDEPKKVMLKARHDGYTPLVHTRTYEFDKRSVLSIVDQFNKEAEALVSFILAPGVVSEIAGEAVCLRMGSRMIQMSFRSDSEFQIETNSVMYSVQYGLQERTKGIFIKTNSRCFQTDIHF